MWNHAAIIKARLSHAREAALRFMISAGESSATSLQSPLRRVFCQTHLSSADKKPTSLTKWAVHSSAILNVILVLFVRILTLLIRCPPQIETVVALLKINQAYYHFKLMKNLKGLQTEKQSVSSKSWVAFKRWHKREKRDIGEAYRS